ncbi:hypothetical protein C8R44DRAFT_959194, partial [Mycena epipterygia]
IPLLLASTGTCTTKFLGPHPSRISDQEGPVLVEEGFLEVHGVCGVNVFGMVCDEGLGDGLEDNVHLERGPSTIDPAMDVFTDDEIRLVDFETQNLGLDEVYG